MQALPDCHAHLDKFGDGVPTLLDAAAAAGVQPIVSVGMDAESSQETVELAWRLRNIKAAVGLHPWSVGERYTGTDSLAPFEDIASDTMVVAVSEVGLDSEIEAPLDVQREVLEWFILLAQDRGFPLILHQQGPLELFLDIWDSVQGRKPAAAIHSFKGGRQDADAYLERGLYLSLGPISLGLIGDAKIDDDVIRAMPETKLLVDSDAFPAFDPWPEVHPTAVVDVAQRVAQIRGVSLEELQRSIGGTFTQLMHNQS
ncbi:MAG TPA: TatD family hydrolase [Gaiellaceae bacterium]|nr:TatD family hydrolase [Gaiellaceae bacterium]